MHRFRSTSAFNPSVRTVTMAMSRTPAHRWGTTAQAISTTASSWVWAHGPAGVTATDGEATASMVTVEEAITVESAELPTVNDRAAKSAQTVGGPMLVDRARVQVIVHRPPRH